VEADARGPRAIRSALWHRHFWGGLDKHITSEHRKAVTDDLSAQQKIYVNVEFSQADHGFFCAEPASYEPRSAQQAWALTLEFLRS
jgi:carboxymethylenebutenolidase